MGGWGGGVMHASIYSSVEQRMLLKPVFVFERFLSKGFFFFFKKLLLYLYLNNISRRSFSLSFLFFLKEKGMPPSLEYKMQRT